MQKPHLQRKSEEERGVSAFSECSVSVRQHSSPIRSNKNSDLGDIPPSSGKSGKPDRSRTRAIEEVRLFQTEGLAVGTLVHGRICLMRSDLNAVEAAKVLRFAMVCALCYVAADTLVGGIAARMLMLVIHRNTYLRKSEFVRNRTSIACPAIARIIHVHCCSEPPFHSDPQCNESQELFPEMSGFAKRSICEYIN